MKIRNIIFSILAGAFLLTSCSKPEEETVINTTKPSTQPSGNENDKPNFRPSTIKVGTYNVWVISNSDKNEGYQWRDRKARLAESIVKNDFDIFGLQEIDATIQNELPAAVKKLNDDKYEWVFNKYSHTAFAYNKKRFKVSNTTIFWLSDTPDKQSKCWDGYDRLAIYTEVFDDISGKKFGLIATHGPLNEDQYRLNMANLLNARAAKYAKDQFPVILVGDLNTKTHEIGYTKLCEYWIDSYNAVPVKFKYGPVGSFNGHKTTNDLNDVTRRIDYIMFRDPDNKVELLTYRNDNSTYDGFYPSDHCPVSVQFNLN